MQNILLLTDYHRLLRETKIAIMEDEEFKKFANSFPPDYDISQILEYPQNQSILIKTQTDNRNPWHLTINLTLCNLDPLLPHNDQFS
jgi:hypothetical protein